MRVSVYKITWHVAVHAVGPYPVGDPRRVGPYPVGDPRNNAPAPYPAGDPRNPPSPSYPAGDPRNQAPVYPVGDPRNAATYQPGPGETPRFVQNLPDQTELVVAVNQDAAIAALPKAVAPNRNDVTAVVNVC